MKRMILLAFMALMLASCGQKSQEEVDRLQQENLELKDQLATKDETFNDFFGSLNEIEENLALIKEKENIISEGTQNDLEGNSDMMDHINEDIRMIGELMEKNRQLINRLNRDISNSNVKVAEFEKMVTRLNEQIDEKELEIGNLKEQLGQMNLRVDYLSATVDTLQQVASQREQIIEEKISEMNTAFYTMGSRRELIDWGIITREGGFLGIGRTNRLNSSFDHTNFTRIDITQTREITVAGQNPIFITPHPEGTWEYRVEDEVTYLVILDPTKFWSASKYLVIEIE
ncbi:MAG: hypothetical protein V2I46_01335 [Bacteroides sp.]|jgi:myosin heavy subunit|nr:hypothetical protein [Bacteroides sp.]